MLFCRLSKDNKEEVLEKAGKDLEAVRDQHFSRLMRELQGTDFWKLRRAYSPGVCEKINHSSSVPFMVNGFNRYVLCFCVTYRCKNMLRLQRFISSVCVGLYVLSMRLTQRLYHLATLL